MSTLPPSRFLHLLHPRSIPRAVVLLLLCLGLLGVAWLTHFALDGAREQLLHSAATAAAASPFAEPGTRVAF